jgi:hypothetical protein
MATMPDNTLGMWEEWVLVLTYGALVVPAILRKFTFKMFLIAGVLNFLKENFFYVWINIFGDLNNYYGWYTGSPLNPDGVWGYNITNPYNMPQYLAVNVLRYALIGLAYFIIRRAKTYPNPQKAVSK